MRPERWTDMPDAGDGINFMSCHRIEPHIIDMARGVTSNQDAQLARHILGCPSCAGLLERERMMSAALRRLSTDLKEPAANPEREQALLSMFDQAATRPGSRVHARAWTSLAAAGLAGAAVLTWHLAGALSAPRISTPPPIAVARETRQSDMLEASPLVAAVEPPISLPARRRATRNADLRFDETADSTEFVAWPGATAWPPFESGELIRIDIPTENGVVQAEILVGQDGFARAIRLVQ
jgi:hypothetical protein